MSGFLKIVAIGSLYIAICGSWSPIQAQTPGTVTSHATRAAVSPKLDGVLDDEIWSGPPLPLEQWVSYNPLRGERAAQATSVWMAYDESAIYFAFKSFDSDPGTIRTTISRRDTAWSSSCPRAGSSRGCFTDSDGVSRSSRNHGETRASRPGALAAFLTTSAARRFGTSSEPASRKASR